MNQSILIRYEACQGQEQCDTWNVDMGADMRRVQLTFELDIKLTMSVRKMLPGHIQGMETWREGGTSDMSELSRELVN